jgi:hypothetical protein
MGCDLIFPPAREWSIANRKYKRPFADGRTNAPARERMIGTAAELLLPGALLVTIQAQLLAAFMFIDFGLAAFFN